MLHVPVCGNTELAVVHVLQTFSRIANTITSSLWVDMDIHVSLKQLFVKRAQLYKPDLRTSITRRQAY